MGVDYGRMTPMARTRSLPDKDAPKPGDVVEGLHSEGDYVIGFVSRIGFGHTFVRDDANRLWDFKRIPLTVIERRHAPSFEYLGWTYAELNDVKKPD